MPPSRRCAGARGRVRPRAAEPRRSRRSCTSKRAHHHPGPAPSSTGTWMVMARASKFHHACPCFVFTHAHASSSLLPWPPPSIQHTSCDRSSARAMIHQQLPCDAACRRGCSAQHAQHAHTHDPPFLLCPYRSRLDPRARQCWAVGLDLMEQIIIFGGYLSIY